MQPTQYPDKLHRIEKTIEVDVPVTTAYNQWTQFESFPQFMESVRAVEQIDDKHLHWVADIGGERKEWTAEIVEQVPDRVVSWRSTSGTFVSGSVSFQTLEPSRCRIGLIMTYAPEGFTEKVGDVLGVLGSEINGDLRRFKRFIEERQVATGGWRGELHEGQSKRKKGAKGADDELAEGLQSTGRF